MASNRDDPLSTFMSPSTSSPVTVSDGDSFLLDTPQIGSASGSLQNDGFLTALDAGGGGASSGSDAEFGFTRSAFRQSPLVGSVDYYQRHVFLCYKNPQVWPPRIEAAEFDRLPRLLSAVLVARKSDMKRQTRLTICEGHDGTETSNGDVLIFPDMIRYRRLTHFDVDTFVEEVLVKDGEWLPGSPEPLRGSYIFVCAHGTRDRRCGVCGPAVIARFKDEIESHGLQSKVSVRPCSHIGGHKYAGNVIIFGSSINGKVSGHWYGYVMPDDVITLLKQHIEKGEVVDWLWRGQMGLSEEDQKKSLDLRVQANGGSNMDRSPNESEQTNEITSLACGSHLERTSCCQTNGKSPCCCSPVSPEKPESPDLNRVMFTADKAKGSKKQVSRSSSGKGTSTRKVCTMPTWFESWEREDTYAVLAVISAAVSVVVAYNCYKHLSDGSRAVSSTESFLCSLEDILSRNSTGRGRAWMSEAINKPSQAIENRSTPENDCTNLAGGHSCESNHCQGLDLLRHRRRRR